jgi:hypothetical protein
MSVNKSTTELEDFDPVPASIPAPGLPVDV